MVRINHYLKPNHYAESPNNIIIVDTESKISVKKDGSQAQTFRLGYAIHLIRQKNGWSESGHVLRSVDDFWNLLDGCVRAKSKLYVFAHNMAYDYAILKLDSYISSRKKEITMRVIDSVFMVKVEGIVFLSSTNFYRQSLKELGVIFGLAKMESPNFETVSDDKLMPYCIRDTQVLSTIIKQHIAFIVDNDLGSFKPTIAGQAMTAFRHRFMKHDLLVHNHLDILRMEKDSYRGGRCEVFRMGKFEDITCLDINSMYPFVMKGCKYPTTLISSKIFFSVSESEIRESISKGLWILAYCYVILKKPCLAFKSDKLLFPVGKLKLVLTSPEIEFLLNNPDCGRILTFDECAYYNQASIFSEYVDFFYEIKTNGKNEATKQMAKVALNSLYGKFAQKNSSESELITDEIQKKLYLDMMADYDTFEIIDDKFGKYVKLGDDLYHIKKSEGDFASDSIPIIASAVTANARMILWRLIEKAGRENVYYVDTDSLFVNSEGLANLHSEINPKELGKLKVEKSGSCSIRGCKDYTFNGVVKLKGIKSNAKKISEDTFEQFQFETKHRRYSEGTPDGTVIVRPIIKKLRRKYDKGSVGESGRVRPLKLS